MKKQDNEVKSAKGFEVVNPNAAGIDIGSREYYVAIPPDKNAVSVRKFETFTEDHEKIAKWLKENLITTVAMESTGVYWIPLFEYLESQGFEVILVNARHVKNLRGKKTDVQDCQWLQKLHTYGLLQGAFRPDDEYCVLRGLLRHRKNLIEKASKEVQHMQKALTQMNLKLQNVISQITSITGMRIIRDIVSGITDAHSLSKHRDPRCKKSEEEIRKSLEGNYRKEHLFSLKQSLEAYDFYQKQIEDCDKEMESYLDNLSGLSGGSDSNNKAVEEKLKQICGVDLTKIEGIGVDTVLTILAEVGPNVNEFPTVKHFASWLRLCPGNQISGGKVLHSKTQPSNNRLRTALKMSAATLHRSQTGLGAYFRKIKSRAGTSKAITATAHKLARYIYAMLKNGQEYTSQSIEEYETKFKEKTLRYLHKKAQLLGFELQPIPSLT